MAANKFATMLHRNTNKMVVILVYTVLEWTLIALLLLNALFSFLIAKFAAFFGLKPPCIFCSRVDHVLEPGKSHLHLLCDSHAAEVSGLGYCSRHRKLAAARDMCDDCSSSRPSDRTITLVSWMERSEGKEKDLRCSCCDRLYSPFLLLEPSWSVLEITQKGNLVEGATEISEELDNGENFGGEVKGEDHQWKGEKDGAQVEGECKIGSTISEQELEEEDALFEIADLRSANIVDEARLVPVELENPIASWGRGEDDGELGNDPLTIDSTNRITEFVSIAEIKNRGSSEILDNMVEVVQEHPFAAPAEESSGNCSDYHQCPQDGVDVETEAALAGADDPAGVQASENDTKAMNAESNCSISLGSCDHQQIDQTHFHESVSLPIEVEAQCSENYNETTDRDQAKETEAIGINVRGVDRLSVSPEPNEVDEERMPETPTSIEGIHALHKRFFFERREFGTESLDGSVASEIEGGEMLTVDRLKSALRAERKALSALYAEFEEERSASAIAANQTMAMITRLQEEKAAMQMEALQYQRMMEEQSEYDQEALQFMSELMTKREKEKQDVEKELEVYRKKVLLYDAKERRKSARSKANGRSGSSSASSSAEDSDDMSFDFHESDENTPTGAVLSSENAKHLITLDESLDDFEEERVSILVQLKALEEKLFTLKDEEPSINLEATENLTEENGHGLSGDYEASSNDDHRRSIGYSGKRLLPLFDAVSIENEEENDATPESVSKFSMDNKRLAIAKEVDHVYERLHSLEADREFLKHCMSSLKKGDKGMDLLREILQHLRDLRNVELRVRIAGDELASFSV